MEAGKCVIWGQGLTVVMSGGRVSGDWYTPVLILILRTRLGPGTSSQFPLSRRFGWNFHWRKPRASRGEAGQAEPGHSQAAHGPGAQDKKVIVLSSAGLHSAGGAHGWDRAYKTSKNPGQVFTCEAAKPRQGPGSSRSPWPDPGPTYINDFPWITVKWFYLWSIFKFIIGTEHERSLFLEATWDLIQTRYYLYREYPGS